MSFATSKLRPTHAKAFVRHRSSAAVAAASSSSHLEAKSRVREHARHISRSTTANATVASAVYVLLFSPNLLNNTRIGGQILPILSLPSLCPQLHQAPLSPTMDP